MSIPARPPWWSRRGYGLLLALAMAVPLLWPTVAPLADLPGHLGRFRIELDIARSPHLHRWFDVRWSPIGNLGVDLLVMPLGRLIGLEPAVRIVVAAIPALAAAGYLLIAREAHGRLPPTAAFALPLILGYPFQFGFINYALSLSLALLGFALWLRLGRLRRVRLRAALFVPLSLAVWIAHASGWAVLALCCAAAELVRAWQVRGRRVTVPLVAALACLPLVPTLLLMLVWQQGDVAAGGTHGFFDWQGKLGWLRSALRDRWKGLDGLSVELLLVLVASGVVRLLRFDRLLLAVTAAIGIAYALLPGTMLGSHYADMRLAPVLLAFAVLALRPREDAPRWVAPALALAALGFFAVRIAASTASLALYAQDHERQLAAIPHIPRGSRVYVLVAPPCPRGWASARLDHLGSMAIVRREAFTNDQWAQTSAQTLSIHAPLPPSFRLDPSQIVRLPGCDRPEPLLADRLATFPRAAFDMVWLVNVPRTARPRDRGLAPVWQSDAGALYRIVRPR